MKSVNRVRVGGLAVAVLVASSGCAVDGLDGVGLEELEKKTTGPLSSPSQTLLWSGQVGPEDAPLDICEGQPCDVIPFTVDLPDGVWQGHSGVVQVSARWEFVFDSLQIWVYKGDTLVASALGALTEAEVAHIPLAENGDYTIYLGWEPTSENDTIAYDLAVQVEYDISPTPTRDLLPDLQMRTSPNVTFDTPSFTFFDWPQPAPGETCYPSEVEEDGAQVCLRFDQVLANRGEGNLEMRLAIPNDPEDPSHDALQRVYRSDGSFYDRVAGEWEFHEAHGHYHYQGFAQARLWAADSAGKRVGSGPVVSGRKVSFCIIDTRLDAFGQQGDAPRTYVIPTCLFPTVFDETFGYIVSGVTRGWADVYDWFLPDQYIDVAGLPDGHYVIDNVADPENGILEADENNNCLGVHIFMQNVDLPSRSVTILGDAKKCK